MNYYKSKKVKKLSLIIVSSLLFNVVGCSRNEEPVDVEKVNVSVIMEDSTPIDTIYTLIATNTSTKTTSTNTSIITTNTDIITTNTTITVVEDEDVDIITDEPDSYTEHTEMEDYSSVVSPVISKDAVTKKVSVATTNTSKITTSSTTSKTPTSSTTSTTSTTTTTLITGSNNKEFVKTFSRGTYYPYPAGTKGGSGRTLIDCSIGDGTVKGSIASSYLYSMYGYNRNGRTIVYLEIPSHPEMDGYYYVDDCDAWNPNVIDFYYYTANNCPFKMEGVITVNCYIV